MAKMLDTIRSLHVDYLECDDEQQREDCYLELRNTITDYLSQENLNMKFTRREFAELLEYNIENKSQFSISGTCQAFEALEKYANNLLLFPWRHEYREIKLYGGFFKHKVARHLEGVEKIFKLMGYKAFDDTTLVFVEPINPDKLIDVGLNCLIGSCECTLIQEFYQHAIDSGCHCGYKECYKLRKTVKDKTKSKSSLYKPSPFYTNGHSGDSKSKTDYNSKRETFNPEDLYERVCKPTLLDHKTTKTLPSSRDLFKPETHDRHIEASISALNLNDLSSTHKSLSQPAETRASTWGYVDNTLAYNYDAVRKQKIPVEDDDEDVALRRQQKANQLLDGNSHADGDMIGNRPNLIYPPYNTAYLISGVMAHPVSALLSCPPPPGYMYDRNVYTDRNRIPVYSIAPYDQQLHRVSNQHADGNGLVEPKTSQRSSVYDNVSSDCGHERASEPTKQWNKAVNSSKYVDDLIDPMPSPPSPFNKNKDEFLIDYDTSKRQKFETEIKMGKSKRQGVKEKTPIGLQSRECRSEETAEKRSSSSGSSSVLSIDENQWQCPSCTMLNPAEDKICKMCSRSKTKGPEAIPLKSGGKECAQCTFINEANAMQCSVCLTKLSPDNSSTYV
uniref:RanBP2-type domain-containing protein n=1 Tax=Strigamia maritima TaxID=126957 RepID=T1J0M3_STRMM